MKIKALFEKMWISVTVKKKKKKQQTDFTTSRETCWQTDTAYLLYLHPTTAIGAKISNAHAFIY